MGRILPVEDTGRRRWGRKIYRFTSAYIYTYNTRPYAECYVEILIPCGAETDFATIPWPLHYVLPADGPWKRGAAVHDLLCRQGVPRFFADAMFRHVMEEDRVRIRCILYYAVRIWYVTIGWWFRPLCGRIRSLCRRYLPLDKLLR